LGIPANAPLPLVAALKHWFEDMSRSLPINGVDLTVIEIFMAKLRDVTELIQKTYAAIWREWYTNHPACLPAVVTVDLKCTDAGYSHKLNRIIISLGDGNLDDYDILDASTWNIWKYQLIHEMLHEYQFKALTEPSEAGSALYNSHPRRFWGPGHDELFFSAICDRAPYFNFTPKELLDRI
jgi:hypothetical protein